MKTGNSKTGGRRVLLGRISGPHGIRGEVLIKTFTAEPEDIEAYGPLQDEAGRRFFEIDVKRVTPKGVIAMVSGIPDRTAAEKLGQVDLYVERDKLPPPDEGEFYHVDLIGLQAVDPQGTVLGRVVNVSNFGAGDILEVQPVVGGKTVLWPMIADVVREVDLDAGQVVIVPPTEVDAGDAQGSPEGDSDETPSD